MCLSTTYSPAPPSPVAVVAPAIAGAGTPDGRMKQDLGATLAEMEHLRVLNRLLSEGKAVRDEAQCRLKSENAELWDQVRDQRRRIDDLSRQLQAVQEVVKAGGTSRNVGAEVVDFATAVANAVSNSTAMGSSPPQSLSSPDTPPSPASLFATPTSYLNPDMDQVDSEPAVGEPSSPSSAGSLSPDVAKFGKISSGARFKFEAAREAIPVISSVVAAPAPAPAAAPAPALAAAPALAPVPGPTPALLRETTAPVVAAMLGRSLSPTERSEAGLSAQLSNLKAQMAAVEAQGLSLRTATRAVEEEYRRMVASSWRNQPAPDATSLPSVFSPSCLAAGGSGDRDGIATYDDRLSLLQRSTC